MIMGVFVLQVLGLPPGEVLETATRKKKFFGEFLHSSQRRAF